jgi:glyoxylase-like metal-dependent hydrolase (beta-lactamase superfamily II)
MATIVAFREIAVVFGHAIQDFQGEMMLQWQIGDVRVTRVVELQIPGKVTWILPDATPENLLSVDWCKPHFVREDGNGIMSVHALVVESQGQRIIVDTCIGNDKNLPAVKAWHKKQDGVFLTELSDAGFSPESIDTVLCTHLHVDHVGWNTRLQDGKWVPTFQNARHLWNKDEYDYWSTSEDQSYGDVVGESVKPVYEAGLVDLVGPEHVVTDEVCLEPTPGHTPGHVSVHIRSRGEEAVITGDLIHHPAQIARPEWRSSADWDGAMGEATRRDFLDRYADRPVLIIGTHFATPTAGKLVRDGETFRLDV